MPVASGGMATGTLAILLATAAFLVDHMTRGSAPSWFVGAASTMQVIAVALVLTGKWKPWYRVFLAMSLFVTMTMALNLTSLAPDVIGQATAGGCHAAVYFYLLTWFYGSLRPGREPVVTILARRLRRTMPAKVVRYTRYVTIAWCLFFATQLSFSAILLAFAPEAVWTTFVTLLNVPLIALMVLAEFGCRRILFQHEPHTSLLDTMAAFRHAHVTPVDRP